MSREFTGRDMAKVLVIGFGIVFAVNFLMANLATRGFGGVVVENSYVASQKFNQWLDEAERSQALGWTANVTRNEDGHLGVETAGVPEDAAITAQLRRPIGKNETDAITFARDESGIYHSTEPVTQGRWIVRLAITSGQDRWSQETPLR